MFIFHIVPYYSNIVKTFIFKSVPRTGRLSQPDFLRPCDVAPAGPRRPPGALPPDPPGDHRPRPVPRRDSRLGREARALRSRGKPRLSPRHYRTRSFTVLYFSRPLSGGPPGSPRSASRLSRPVAALRGLPRSRQMDRGQDQGFNTVLRENKSTAVPYYLGRGVMLT